MGSILRAKCKCGFTSETILAGGGMLNFHEVCNAPAICLNCNLFLIKNYMKKYSKCPKCRKKVTFYNNPQIQKKMPESYKKYNEIFCWYIDKIKGTFRLPDTQYFCPNCKEMTLEFFDLGNWD